MSINHKPTFQVGQRADDASGAANAKVPTDAAVAFTDLGGTNPEKKDEGKDASGSAASSAAALPNPATHHIFSIVLSNLVRFRVVTVNSCYI